MTAPDGESLPLPKSSAKVFRTALAVTFLVGVALRSQFPGDAPFAADEAFALVLGGDWLQHPCIALHGMPASVGISNPPASVYFFAAIHACSHGDPLAATFAVIAWNTLGLILAGFYLRRPGPLGPFWAWWAMAFLCLSPWAVLLSRKIWAQDLLLPLVVTALWGLEAIWTRWGWPRIIAGVACALLVSQVHMSGMVWLVALALPCAALWPKEQKRRLVPFLLLCAGIYLVLYAPWFVYLLRNRPEGRLPTDGAGFWNAGVSAVRQYFGVWTGLGTSLDFCFGAGEARFAETMGSVWTAGQRVLLLVTGVAAAAALAELFRALRRRRDAEARKENGETGISADVLPASTGALFIGALVLFPVLIVVLGIPAYRHYGAVLVFPAAVALAAGLDMIEKRWGNQRAPRGLIRGAACLVLALNLWTTLGFFARVHAAGGTLGDYGPTLDFKTREIAKIARQGQDKLPDSAPLEYHYLLDRLKGRRTRLEDHPRPY